MFEYVVCCLIFVCRHLVKRLKVPLDGASSLLGSCPKSNPVIRHENTLPSFSLLDKLSKQPLILLVSQK